MRKLSFIFASLLLGRHHVCTRSESNQIKLRQKQSSIMKALSDRHSDREYAAKGTQFTGSIGSIMGSKRD